MGIKTHLHGFIDEVSKRKVQPLQLARELEKAMEAAKMILPLRTFIPNRYRVRINADDLEARKDLFEELRLQLERHLVEKARAQKYHLLTAGISVTIERARGLERDEIEIQSDYAEPTASRSPLLKLFARGGDFEKSGELKAAPGEGFGLPRDAVSFDPRTRCFTISLSEGSTIGIGREAEIRTLDTPQDYIGRRHAGLRRQGDCYFLKDLGSLNGTWVNGEDIKATREEKKLQDGDRIEIGGRGYLIFEVELEEGGGLEKSPHVAI